MISSWAEEARPACRKPRLRQRRPIRRARPPSPVKKRSSVVPNPQALPSLSREDGAALAGENGSSEAAPETEILERNSSGDPSRVMMQIDRISTHGYNTKRFHMTNGQVWEVTDGMRFSIPRNVDTLSAEIRTASFGGYFLRIEGEGRAIRVRRID